jgi:hypothetical protein
MIPALSRRAADMAGTRVRSAVIVAGIVAAGCSAAPVRPTPAPFTCEGAPAAANGTRRTTEGPIGRLEVRSLDAAPKEPVARAKLEDWLPWRLKITAERISVGRLASSLAEVLALDIVVDAGIMDARVYLALPEATFERVLRVLSEHYEVIGEFRDGVLLLQGAEKKRPAPGAEPLATRWIEAADGATPEQLAAAWCKGAASPRGTASVLGSSVLFRDVAEALGRASEMAQQLKPKAAAPEPARADEGRK